MHIIAFDIDKLHGGIYIIFSNKTFYRIVKKPKNERDDSGSSIYKVTNEADIREVLPLGMPLGTCSIVYDSVTGRVIIGDNYKIQALYI